MFGERRKRNKFTSLVSNKQAADPKIYQQCRDKGRIETKVPEGMPEQY